MALIVIVHKKFFDTFWCDEYRKLGTLTRMIEMKKRYLILLLFLSINVEFFTSFKNVK